MRKYDFYMVFFCHRMGPLRMLYSDTLTVVNTLPWCAGQTLSCYSLVGFDSIGPRRGVAVVIFGVSYVLFAY